MRKQTLQVRSEEGIYQEKFIESTAKVYESAQSSLMRFFSFFLPFQTEYQNTQEYLNERKLNEIFLQELLRKIL